MALATILGGNSLAMPKVMALTPGGSEVQSVASINLSSTIYAAAQNTPDVNAMSDEAAIELAKERNLA